MFKKSVRRITAMATRRMEEAEGILREVGLISPETMVVGSLEYMRVRLDRCVGLAGEDGLVKQHVGQLEQLDEGEAIELRGVLESWMIQTQEELRLQEARLVSMESMQAKRQLEARSLRQQVAGMQDLGPRLGRGDLLGEAGAGWDPWLFGAKAEAEAKKEAAAAELAEAENKASVEDDEKEDEVATEDAQEAVEILSIEETEEVAANLPEEVATEKVAEEAAVAMQEDGAAKTAEIEAALVGDDIVEVAVPEELALVEDVDEAAASVELASVVDVVNKAVPAEEAAVEDDVAEEAAAPMELAPVIEVAAPVAVEHEAVEIMEIEDADESRETSPTSEGSGGGLSDAILSGSVVSPVDELDENHSSDAEEELDDSLLAGSLDSSEEGSDENDASDAGDEQDGSLLAEKDETNEVEEPAEAETEEDNKDYLNLMTGDEDNLFKEDDKIAMENSEKNPENRAEKVSDENYNSSEDENNNLNCHKAFKCDLCTKVFRSSTLFQRHQKTHKEKYCQNCPECDKPFASKSSLSAHLKAHQESKTKTHQESKTFSCPHCQREFKGRKSLLEHISAQHNQEGRLVCAQCPASFVSKHLKNVHEREHNGEKGYICDQCGESFATVQGLSHHKSKHTGDYQYRCQACDKGFNNYKLLEEHHHIHTGIKPYQCSKCDKGFANRGSWWIHVKQHESSKPYVCSECSKSFAHSSHLAVHKRIHSGEKPYRCRLCGEGFISSNHLKRHMKTHANQLPFACALCKQTFSQRRQLVSHSNKAHGWKLEEEAKPASPPPPAKVAKTVVQPQVRSCNSGPDWQEGDSTLPQGWKKRFNPGLGVDQILSPHGHVFRDRAEGLKYIMENNRVYSEQDRRNMEDRLGFEGWETEPLLPKGWKLEEDRNGDEVIVHPDGRKFPSRVMAVEWMIKTKQEPKSIYNMWSSLDTEGWELGDQHVPAGWRVKHHPGICDYKYLTREMKVLSSTEQARQVIKKSADYDEENEKNFEEWLREFKKTQQIISWKKDGSLPGSWFLSTNLNHEVIKDDKGSLFEGRKEAIDHMIREKYPPTDIFKLWNKLPQVRGPTVSSCEAEKQLFYHSLAIGEVAKTSPLEQLNQFPESHFSDLHLTQLLCTMLLL